MVSEKSKPEVVVITGASAGVGRAVVREFARDRAHVGLIARGIDGLRAAQREVESAGGRAVMVPTDVSNPDDVDAAAERIERELGPIDIWINVAMVSTFAPFIKITPDEFRRITDVTYLGFVWGTMAALRRMMPRNRGKIVQVGSALAYRSIPLQSAYCGAKHAIVGFTESLRTELIHQRSDVKLTMVHLPGVNTTQFLWTRNKMPHTPRPVGTVYQPEVPARAIHWAAHHDRRQLLVGYPTFESVVGEKLVPGLLDHYLADVAWKGSMTQTPADRQKPDNLFHPLPGDWGAHGPFDSEATERSLETIMAEHRGAIGLGVLALLAGGALLAAWAGSQRSEIRSQRQ